MGEANAVARLVLGARALEKVEDAFFIALSDAAVATAIAIDLGHLENWLNDIPLAPTRTSHFARLAFDPERRPERVGLVFDELKKIAADAGTPISDE